MKQWVKIIIILGVFSVWAVYMSVTLLALHQRPADPLWAVPGATYVTLMGRPKSSHSNKDEQ